MQVFRTLFWGETHLSQRCVWWDWSFICWRLLLGPNGKAWDCLSSPSFLGFVYNLCLREGEHVRLPIRPFKLWPFRLAEVVEPRGPLQKLCVPTSPCSLPPCSHTSTQSRKRVGWGRKRVGQMEEQTEKSKLHTLWGMKPGFSAALCLAGALEAPTVHCVSLHPTEVTKPGAC